MFLKIGDNQGIEGFHHKSSCVAVQIAGHALTDFQNVPTLRLDFYDERHLARYQIQDISQGRNAFLAIEKLVFLQFLIVAIFDTVAFLHS